MAGDVAEGFAGDRQELADEIGRQVRIARVRGVEVDVDHAVDAELVGQGGQAADQPGLLEQLRPEAEDEVADVADRLVERVDGPLDSRAGLVGLVRHQVRHVLEREADGVDALDDAVVQVAADPLALLDDGQALDLLVEPGVLDGDAGVQGEHLDEPLVVLGEVAGGLLVGQVQPADRPALGPDRDAQQRVHRRVVRREAVAARVGGDVGTRIGCGLARDHAEQAVAVRRGADPLALGAADAAGDEPLDAAVLVDDTEGGVLGVGQLADAIGDQLQDAVQVQDAGDAAGGSVEGGQLVRGLARRGPSTRPSRRRSRGRGRIRRPRRRRPEAASSRSVARTRSPKRSS